MRTLVRRAACLAAVVSVGACSAMDFEYYRTGVGTNLYTADMPAATDLQNLYLNYLCRQSSPVVAPGGDDRCGAELPPGIWPLVVQAGMNDIDQRCDAYLAWLDEKRRTNSAILEELGIIRGAADLVINAQFGAGPRSLAALAAAFTLATGTFGKLSSFLLQAEQSTVMTVVLGRRKEFRLQILKTRIENRPMAIHALRSYLTICMPMTIVTDINTTVTVFQQGGPAAVGGHTIVDASTVGRPLTAKDQLKKQVRAQPELDPIYLTIIDGNAAAYDNRYIQTALRALCVPSGDVDIVDARTRELIRVFEAHRYRGKDRKNLNGKLNRNELRTLIGSRACDSGQFRNYYEKVLYRDSRNVAALMKLLSKIPGSPAVDQTLTAARDRIRDARKHVGLIVKIPGLEDQVTPDLIDKLEEL